MWQELPDWVKPDIRLDDENVLRFFTDTEHAPTPTGATWWHISKKGEDPGWHAGGFQWIKTQYYNGPVWDLVQLSPLTISPSLLCDCGAHGFIRNGIWIPA